MFTNLSAALRQFTLGGLLLLATNMAFAQTIDQQAGLSSDQPRQMACEGKVCASLSQAITAAGNALKSIFVPPSNPVQVCSGNGYKSLFGICICDQGYDGANCQKQKKPPPPDVNPRDDSQ